MCPRGELTPLRLFEERNWDRATDKLVSPHQFYGNDLPGNLPQNPAWHLSTVFFSLTTHTAKKKKKESSHIQMSDSPVKQKLCVSYKNYTICFCWYETPQRADSTVIMSTVHCAHCSLKVLQHLPHAVFLLPTRRVASPTSFMAYQTPKTLHSCSHLEKVITATII